MLTDRLSPEDVEKMWEAAKVPEEYGDNYSHNIYLVRVTANDHMLYGYIHDRTTHVTVPLIPDPTSFGRTQMASHNLSNLGLNKDYYGDSSIMRALGLNRQPRSDGFHHGHVSEGARLTGYLVSPNNLESGFLLDIAKEKELRPQDVAERLQRELGFKVEPVMPETLLNLEVQNDSR